MKLSWQSSYSIVCFSVYLVLYKDALLSIQSFQNAVHISFFIKYPILMALYQTILSLVYLFVCMYSYLYDPKCLFEW